MKMMVIIIITIIINIIIIKIIIMIIIIIIMKTTGALWVSSAGRVVMKRLLDEDGLKEMNVAVMECSFLSRPFDEEGKPI